MMHMDGTDALTQSHSAGNMRTATGLWTVTQQSKIVGGVSRSWR